MALTMPSSVLLLPLSLYIVFGMEPERQGIQGGTL